MQITLSLKPATFWRGFTLRELRALQESLAGEITAREKGPRSRQKRKEAMMTRQEVFDKVVAHLRAQGRKAVNERGDCVYHAPDGTKCADLEEWEDRLAGTARAHGLTYDEPVAS